MTPPRLPFNPYVNAVALVTLGFVLGGMLSIVAPLVIDAGMERYDQMFPVIQVETRIVSHQDGQVVLHMVGDKRRSCIFVGINAYASKPRAEMPSRIYMQRVDIPSTGETRPVGRFDMGTWRVWPTENTREIAVYTQHVCNGRLVATPIARLNIKPGDFAPRLVG